MEKSIKLIKSITRSKLFAGSAIMVLGGLAGGFLNYLFHLFMGRQLGPEDYGMLASLISVHYLLSVPLGTLSLVIVKHVSSWRGEKNHARINYFYHWLNRKMVGVGAASVLIFLVFSPAIARFLHLDSLSLLWLTGAAFVVGIFSLINTAFFQGFLRFDWVVLTGLAGSLAKLGLSIVLVVFGWRVFGPVVAIFSSALLGFLWTIVLIRKLVGTKVKKTELDLGQVVTFFLPAFMSTLALTSLYTTDVVLARHFLSHAEAGFYAALSTLGKIIFFATSPVNTVMFPLISERYAAKKKIGFILGLGLSLVAAAGIAIGLFYFFFPELMISLLYGADYLSVAGSLWLFGVYMGLYSLCAALVNYYLSVKNYRLMIFPIAAAVFQAGLIFFFHHNIVEIVRVSIFSLIILLVALFLPLIKSYKYPGLSFPGKF